MPSSHGSIITPSVLLLPLLAQALACVPSGAIEAEGLKPIEAIESAYVVDYELSSNGERIFTGDVTILSSRPLGPEGVESVLRLKELLFPAFFGANLSIPPESQCAFYLQEYAQALDSLGDVVQEGTTLGLVFAQEPTGPEEAPWVPSLEWGLHTHDLGWSMDFFGPATTDPDIGPIWNMGLVQFEGEALGLFLDYARGMCLGEPPEDEAGRNGIQGGGNDEAYQAHLDARRFWVSDGGALEVKRLGEGSAEIYLAGVSLHEYEPALDSSPDALPEDLGLGGPETGWGANPEAARSVIHSAEFEAEPLIVRTAMDF